jgi:cytochrome P450
VSSLQRLGPQQFVDGFISLGRARKEPGDDLLPRPILAQDEDGTRMTDTQLRDEAMTIYRAGYETTALTLGWTWYALACAAKVEDKLVAEWSAVFGGLPPRSKICRD